MVEYRFSLEQYILANLQSNWGSVKILSGRESTFLVFEMFFTYTYGPSTQIPLCLCIPTVD